MAKSTKKLDERELPERLEFDFIICDNTLNRQFWRLLVEGIDFSGFEKNPVCCHQHSTWSVPVGKWKNLRVEKGQLLGTVEFDRNDEDAVKLYWKYADGYMSACSLNIKPLAESDDVAMLVPGQKYATVTKSELLEISLVTIPGQKNAVKLSNNNEVKFTLDGSEYHLKEIKLNQNSKTMNEDEKKQLEELNKQLSIERERNAANLIKLHQKRGVVAAGEVDYLKKLAIADYETVEKVLEARPDPEPDKVEEKKEEEKTGEKEKEGKELSAKIEELVKGTTAKLAGEKADWNYYEWFKKDPEGLKLMAKNEPDKFKKLEADFALEGKALNLKTGDK